MTFPVKTQFIATLGIVAIVLAGLIAAITVYWIPRFESQRQIIQQNDATIAAIQRQQENLSGLSQQLSQRQSAQEKLNQNLWGFSKEDTFYSLWDDFASATGTVVELESIADAAPGEVPVRRDATLSLNGSLPAIIRAIQKLPTIQPVIILQDLQISPSDKAPNVIAFITVSTLWYDDATQ